MQYVYVVKLASPVQTEPQGHYYSGKQATYLHVVASSFANAQEAVVKKYPKAEVRGIDLLNYSSIPLVIGD